MGRYSHVARKLREPQHLLSEIAPSQEVAQQRQKAFDQMRTKLMAMPFSTDVIRCGSVAKDTDLVGSDIDIVIMVKRPDNSMIDTIRTNLKKSPKCCLDERKHVQYASYFDRCGAVSGSWNGVKFDALIGSPLPESTALEYTSFQQAALLCAHINVVRILPDATKQGIRLAKWWAQQVPPKVWKPSSYLIELICRHVTIQNTVKEPLDVLLAFLELFESTSHDKPFRIIWHWPDTGSLGTAPVVLDPFNRNNNVAEAAHCSDWANIRAAATATLKLIRSASDQRERNLSRGASLEGKLTLSLEALFLQKINELRLEIKDLERRGNMTMIDYENVKHENARLRSELAESKQTSVADNAQIPPCGLEWQFQVDVNAGRWIGMSADLTIRLEVDHEAFRLDPSKHIVTHSSGVERYTFDFTNMLQTNVRTKRERAIQRKMHCPAHWKVNVDWQTVCGLAAANTELKLLAFDITVRSKLRSFTKLLKASVVHHLPNDGSCDCDEFKMDLKVVRVRQIENWELWQRYMTCKRQIKNELQQRDIQVEAITPPLVSALQEFSNQYGGVDRHVNECHLFHGTNPLAAATIAAEGFDFRLSRPGYYGKGTYFGSQACKSHQYANCEDGNRFMIVSRVTLGDTWYAQEVDKSLPRPPIRSNNGRGYDSIIAKPGPMHGHSRGVQSHQEFVLFDKWQAYPEFLIEYSLK